MEIYELTAHELSSMLRDKQVSVTEITKSVLNRIHSIEPKVDSFITICEERALKKAEEIQNKFNNNQPTLPLTGIPMALKDNMCTEGIRTTCSSKVLNNFIPPYDATITKKLADADTILIGKTNLDEFAMGSSTENSAFKNTKNPWDLERVPGGSSGGSAAAVAAGEAIFALGSDTGGSIRQPAAYCGLVGLKPTYGAISRYGLIAFASSLDQIGPLTKDVEDMALVMNVVAGHDPMDSTSANVKYPNYTSFLKNDVKGLKIGVPKEHMTSDSNPEVKKAVIKSLELLKDLGADYEEFSMPLTEYAIPIYYIIAPAEASSNLARYDGIKYGYMTEKFSDLSELYKNSRSESFGDEVKRRIMLGTHALSSGHYDEYYQKALRVRTLIRKQFEEAFQKYDVIIGPTTPETAFKFGAKTENHLAMYLEDIYTVSANIAGIPAMSIPCGFKENLPIGLHLMGKPFDEGTLIKVGYTFQQNTDFHKKRAKV